MRYYMTKLFFDHPKGVVLIDGVRAESGFCTDKKQFSVQYIPYDYDYLPIIQSVDCRLKSSPNLLIIRHKNCLILKFCPSKKPVFSDCYYQQNVKVENTVHILSCKADRIHKITIETQNEIITLPLPAQPHDICFKASKISEGQLLLIRAKLNNKTYLAILHYNDDYTLIMCLVCDKLSVAEGKITVEDYLHDCLQRKCVRVLKFCNNAFIEESRHFEYDCYINYPDELIPYVFLESLKAKDDDMISRYLSPSMRDFDCYGFFGDFAGICDCTEYCPYKISLIYNNNGMLYTKTYLFEVSGGRINYVNCL